MTERGTVQMGAPFKEDAMAGAYSQPPFTI